ncbi:MAG: LPXTG cell wall anchor domain-containing protein [Clostridium perfringens]|uniref:LPXTG cell wall anchor domain-containing protein n=1 Tax=Clostridium perfringens TaxID=1502 RepID=UPI0030D1E1B7
MRRTKSVFLCALLATLAFMPAKDNTVFAKEKVGVTVDVVEEKNNLFNEEIIWEPGSLEESSIKISNNLSKDIVIKTLNFHDEKLLDYVNSSYIDEGDERYKYFLENASIIVKDSDDIIFEGTLKDVFSGGNIKLKDGINVEANNSKLIDLEINISNDLDNRGQGIQNVFNLSVQYEYEDESNNGSGNLPNTGGFSNNNFMIFGVLALGIGASILKLPQKKEEI